MIKRYLLLLFITGFLFSCKQSATVVKTENNQYALNNTVSVDSSTERIISPYRTELSKTMDRVIGETDIALEKGQPESLLGNLIADVALIQTNKNYQPADNIKADFAFLNNGGLRSALPQGKITVGKVYELMPFENELVVVTLNGPEVNQLINYIINKGGVPVSNIRIVIKDKLPKSVKINGSDFDSTKTYKVVTSDYLANGGDNLKLMEIAVAKEFTKIKLRDAIISQFESITASGSKITSQKEGRIKYE